MEVEDIEGSGGGFVSVVIGGMRVVIVASSAEDTATAKEDYAHASR